MKTYDTFEIRFAKDEEVVLKRVGEMEGKEIFSETKYHYDLDTNTKETLRITIEKEELNKAERKVILFNKMFSGVTVVHNKTKEDTDGNT